MPSRPHLPQSALIEETQRRGKLVLKSVPVLLIPIISGLATFVLIRAMMETPPASTPETAASQPLIVVALIVLAVFFTAQIILVRLGRPTISAVLLIGVWTLITTLGTLRGGVESIGPSLLVIPICAAGLLIDGVASMGLATLATVLVGSLAWLETNGFYTVASPQLPIIGQSFSILQTPAFTAGVWTGLYWTVSLLTSLLAGDLQRALHQSRDLSNQLEARVAAQTAELAQRARRAEALYAVSQALTTTLDLDQVLALIAEQAVKLLSFDSAQVLLQQADGSFASLAAYGQPVNLDGQMAVVEPLLREAERQRRPQVVTLPESVQVAGPALLLPMHYRTGLAGVLMLTNASGPTATSEDDLVLGQGLADEAIVAIANAQLLTQARAAATLEERTRLARDIHDTLAQGLTGVVVQLGATQRAFSVAPQEAREHLALALRMARESLAEARRSVWNLRAPALERGDLADALRALSVRPLGGKVAVSFEQRGTARPLPTAVESTLLRVCQEALSNVAKHAQATEASVVLEYRPDDVCLSIHDNGVGFDQPLADVAAAPGPWGGFGLLGMSERVGALGGTLQVSDEGGANIVAVIPRISGP